MSHHTSTSKRRDLNESGRARSPSHGTDEPLVLGPFAALDERQRRPIEVIGPRAQASGPVGWSAAGPSSGVSLSEALANAPRAVTPTTILVVDDDENLLRMLRRGFAFAGYSVCVAADGETALCVALEEEPDLIVLDVMLPEPLDGLEVARRLRAGGFCQPVLMLTAREQLADKIAGFASGADDYLPKPFAFQELLARVAALLRRSSRGGATWQDQTLQYADLSLDPGTREVWRGGEAIDLTAREFDLLAYFLRHPRQVLSRDQLFRAVWGSDFLGASNVVDSCVWCIRQKLEADGRPRLLQTVRGVGYSLRV